MDFGNSIGNIPPFPGKGLLVTGWLLDPHRLLDHLEVILGYRLHGNLMALANAVPAIYFGYDTRTLEEAP